MSGLVVVEVFGPTLFFSARFVVFQGSPWLVDGLIAGDGDLGSRAREVRSLWLLLSGDIYGILKAFVLLI